MTLDDKQHVLHAFHDSLRARLEATASITAAARDEATSEESRPENKYDTRALEASYLAAGQGERLAALRSLVTWLASQTAHPHRSAGAGSLLEIEDEDGQLRRVLLAPQGGERVTLHDTAVELIGIRSPLGSALRGLEPGDEAEVETPQGVRTWELVRLV